MVRIKYKRVSPSSSYDIEGDKIWDRFRLQEQIDISRFDTQQSLDAYLDSIFSTHDMLSRFKEAGQSKIRQAATEWFESNKAPAPPEGPTPSEEELPTEELPPGVEITEVEEIPEGGRRVARVEGEKVIVTEIPSVTVPTEKRPAERRIAELDINEVVRAGVIDVMRRQEEAVRRTEAQATQAAKAPLLVESIRTVTSGVRTVADRLRRFILGR